MLRALIAAMVCVQASALGAARSPAASQLLRRAPRVARALARSAEYATTELNDIELIEQITTLDKLTLELRSEQIKRDFDNAQVLGWCAQAETNNGRFAMFFIVTGLATELFTGQNVPQQIYTMLEVSGVVPPSG